MRNDVKAVFAELYLEGGVVMRRSTGRPAAIEGGRRYRLTDGSRIGCVRAVALLQGSDYPRKPQKVRLTQRYGMSQEQFDLLQRCARLEHDVLHRTPEARAFNVKARPDGYKPLYVADDTHCMYVSYHAAVWALANGRPPAHHIDHKDRDNTNNHPLNLREATDQQNAANAKARGGTSRYRGVSKEAGRWRAGIRVNGKRHYLGKFDSEIDAALAYDRAAVQYFGEFAYQNHPRERV